jgi:prepilin-type N-terminal cleavage/methylation domain-containing protein
MSTRPLPAPSRRDLRGLRVRRGRRGFTLVELMVSLVAGLIVAIGVIGLAKTTTNTFFQQARMAGLEATVRTASDRLKNDLLRISYMGTGNINLDPTCARPAGQVSCSHYVSTNDLQGIHVVPSGSPAATEPLETIAGLTPDLIRIGGNMTTDDMYRGRWSDVASACAGIRLVMNPKADAAVNRLVANGATGVKNTFIPVAGKVFHARVMDSRGCYHYVEVCDAGLDGSGNAWVDIKNDSSSRTILKPGDPASGGDTGTANCGGQFMEEFSISPLQRVDWFISKNPNAADTRLDPDPQIEPADQKYNLYRQFVDASGTVVGSPELVAEYAIDLKFGLVMQDVNNAVTVFDIDDPTTTEIANATKNASATTVGTLGPQNVKAVRFRVTVRGPLEEDRAGITSVLPTYPLRYCLDPTAGSVTACKHFTRTRMIVSEVALINQARMFY